MITSPSDLVLSSTSDEATRSIGRTLGQLIDVPVVIALVGPLGAGKTCLVRGLAEGLDVDARAICSPTFVLLQEYAGRLPIYHFDTYRLTSPDQFAALGPEEYFEGEGVSVVEWADRVPEHLPPDRLEIEITVVGPSDRRLTLWAAGTVPSRLLRRLAVELVRRPL